jgi:hypothetical protein
VNEVQVLRRGGRHARRTGEVFRCGEKKILFVLGVSVYQGHMIELALSEERERIIRDDLAINNAPCVDENTCVPASCSTFAAGRLRGHLAVAASLPEPQPAATAKATPVASAPAFVGGEAKPKQLL